MPEHLPGVEASHPHNRTVPVALPSMSHPAPDPQLALEYLTGARDPAPLLAEAARMRDEGKGRTVTYSRKVFIPLTTLCNDSCTYCTFAKPPGAGGQYMEPDDDIHYSLVGLGILESSGPDFDWHDVCRYWLSHIPVAAICSAEYQAVINFLNRSSRRKDGKVCVCDGGTQPFCRTHGNGCGNGFQKP